MEFYIDVGDLPKLISFCAQF